jgi:hypothetical protein
VAEVSISTTFGVANFLGFDVVNDEQAPASGAPRAGPLKRRRGRYGDGACAALVSSGASANVS